MSGVVAAVVLGLIIRPVRPFLVAEHPIALTLLDGGTTSIASAAALARTGETSSWQVFLGGMLGIVKLNWLTWWAGHRWGDGIIGFFVRGRRASELSARIGAFRPRTMRASVVLASVPGVPSALVFALAGRSGMPLRLFLVLDALGALLLTGLLTATGYQLGQHGVDIVLFVDDHAGLISVVTLAAVIVVPCARRWVGRRRVTPDRRNRRDASSAPHIAVDRASHSMPGPVIGSSNDVPDVVPVAAIPAAEVARRSSTDD